MSSVSNSFTGSYVALGTSLSGAAEPVQVEVRTPHLRSSAASPASSQHEMPALAERKLRESPYFFLRNVHCEFDSGTRTLTLEGWVPFAPLKQFAETIVRRIDGVLDVCNKVEVVDPLRPTDGARAARNAG